MPRTQFSASQQWTGDNGRAGKTPNKTVNWPLDPTKIPVSEKKIRKITDKIFRILLWHQIQIYLWVKVLIIGSYLKHSIKRREQYNISTDLKQSLSLAL